MNKNLALIVLVVFAAGCGLETRTYVMTKDRVGLDHGSGNGGCIMGKCTPVPPTETTRKVYVWEITKPVPESEVRKIEETAVSAIVDTPPATDSAAAASAPAAGQPTAASQVSVPVVGELPGTAASTEEAAPAASTNGGNMQAGTYTVQKDDTLQKISKKVFGTYGKWYKIYEANKEKINNPNVLKPGTVLNIPVIK
jgi:nucleoid-associated protein YgaU